MPTGKVWRRRSRCESKLTARGADLSQSRNSTRGKTALSPARSIFGPEGDQIYLLLFGSGIRQRSSLSAVIATIGGVYAEVSFAGAQGAFAGLDQVNLRVPRSLRGRGEVEALLTVDARIGQSTAHPLLPLKTSLAHLTDWLAVAAIWWGHGRMSVRLDDCGHWLISDLHISIACRCCDSPLGILSP